MQGNTKIPQLLIKTFFLKRGYDKKHFVLSDMIANQNLGVAVKWESKSNDRPTIYTTVEEANNFLTQNNFKQSDIDDFFQHISEKHTQPIDIELKHFETKKEFGEYMSKKHFPAEQAQPTKEEKKEKKKKENAKKNREFFRRRPELLEQRIRQISPLLDKKICFLDFEFDTFRNKIMQAGTITLNNGELQECHNYVFCTKRIKFNPKNYLELSLFDETDSDQPSKHKSESLINLLKEQDTIVVFGGNEDRSLLKKLGIDEKKILDIQHLSMLSSKMPETRSRKSLSFSLETFCSEYGKIDDENYTKPIQDYVKKFSEDQPGHIKKKNKSLFLNGIGLHNAINDSAVTLFLFNEILKDSNIRLLDKPSQQINSMMIDRIKEKVDDVKPTTPKTNKRNKKRGRKIS